MSVPQRLVPAEAAQAEASSGSTSLGTWTCNPYYLQVSESYACTYATAFATFYYTTADLDPRSGVDATVPVPVAGLTSVKAIDAAGGVASALLADGIVQVRGSRSASQFATGLAPVSFTPAPVSGLADATAIAAGSLTQYAISKPSP
jgi:hypothetical protein